MSIPSIYKDDIVFLAKNQDKTIRKSIGRHSDVPDCNRNVIF